MDCLLFFFIILLLGEECQTYPGPKALKIERVEDLVREHFTNAEEANKLQVFKVDDLIDATRDFVLGEHKEAIRVSVERVVETQRKLLEAYNAPSKRKLPVNQEFPKKRRTDEDSVNN
ncbi:hypothetical protein HOLleu_22539 [Holothuria leucospilota]|uniref:Uncharacterized protein n=1 Tax=Holothuria leucospilota TaxID=206669 RepID=A0A9Q1BZ99_HOLLE|nr:hypothetical protein HOLleu_22539 [Holothuria leucospilota]